MIALSSTPLVCTKGSIESIEDLSPAKSGVARYTGVSLVGRCDANGEWVYEIPYVNGLVRGFYIREIVTGDLASGNFIAYSQLNKSKDFWLGLFGGSQSVSSGVINIQLNTTSAGDGIFPVNISNSIPYPQCGRMRFAITGGAASGRFIFYMLVRTVG